MEKNPHRFLRSVFICRFSSGASFNLYYNSKQCPYRFV